MQKIILIICAMVLMNGNIFAQKNNELDKSTETRKMKNYTSEVLIEGKWGTKPGEFGLGMVGEEVVPDEISSDDRGNIYILDKWNMPQCF